MTSVFQSAQLAASAALDAVYGEPFTYRPMARASDVNAPLTPDLDRPVQTVTGAFQDVFARFHAGPARNPGVRPEHPGHSTTRPMVSIDKAALPYAPRVGDRLVRAKDGAVYQVAEVRTEDTQRFECDVNLLRAT